jgi:protein-disulfide isomerase
MDRPLFPILHALPLLALVAVSGPGATARAADPLDAECCRHLDEAELARARAFMDQQFLYDGCDDTVAACLAESSPCDLAIRVAAEICRRVGRGEDDEAISQALLLRARSMIPGGPRAEIDLTGVPAVGDPAAPVVLVEYACVRCPFCSKITPDLVEAVSSGPLAGKVRLYFKLFPIKGHDGSTESGLAAVAALQQGRFWEFMGVAYRRFDRFSVDVLPSWATAAGLEAAAYQRTVSDSASRDLLVQSKREGMANGVDATPTFFISGRRYQAELETMQMIDVLEEEYERSSSAQSR